MINSTFHFEEFLNNVVSGHDKDLVDRDKNLIYTHRKAMVDGMVDGKHMPDCGVTGNKTKKPNGVS